MPSKDMMARSGEEVGTLGTPESTPMQRKLSQPSAFLLLLSVAFAYARGLADPPQRTEGQARPDYWAQPVAVGGAPNLYRVSEDLYRSAQPSADGMRALETMGIKTVVNLRLIHSDRDELAGTHLQYFHLPMVAWHPQEDDVIAFLRIVGDKAYTPVLVHCRVGADRTGIMVAVYRIVVSGWTKDEAIAEMTQGGFGFNPGWENLVQFVRDLDVDAIKRKLEHAATRDAPARSLD